MFWVDDHSDNTSRSSRRHFLRYYAQTFTHLLTTNIENNSFLSSVSFIVSVSCLITDAYSLSSNGNA